jgi:hypothetical protein
MKNEFKIIATGPLMKNVQIFINDTQIGLVQDINFHASCNDVPEIQLVLPILSDSENTVASNYINELLELLKNIPNVKITFQDIA